MALLGHINPSQLKERNNRQYTKCKHIFKLLIAMTIPQKKSHCRAIYTKKQSKTKTNKNPYLKARVLEHPFINPYDCQEHRQRQVIDPSQETRLTTQKCHLSAVWTWPRHYISLIPSFLLDIYTYFF